MPCHRLGVEPGKKARTVGSWTTPSSKDGTYNRSGSSAGFH